MSRRITTWLAWAICGVSLALLVLGLLLRWFNSSAPTPGYAFYPGDLVIAIIFPIVGALIASRKAENAIGWLFCAMGFSGAISFFTDDYALYALITRPGALPGGALMSWVQPWAWLPSFVLLVFLLLLFPNGRLLSRPWRWVAWVGASGDALTLLAIAIFTWPLRGRYLLEHAGGAGFESLPGFDLYNAVGALGLLLTIMSLLGAALSLVLRFRRSQAVERLQLKWFTYAASLAAAALLAGIAYNPNGGYLNGDLLNDLESLLQASAFASIPVATGIAILKYRLYDIDLLINRTLVYGALTGSLAVLYLGSVVSLEALMRPITGQRHNDLVIVISTLIIAALFLPLRARIQSFIDRRFYRRKYDAAKTLSSFSATLRDEVDLDRLTGRLVEVVDETMQPEHVALGLLRPEKGVQKCKTQGISIFVTLSVTLLGRAAGRMG